MCIYVYNIIKFMKVFFGSSGTDLSKYKKEYLVIRDIILKTNQTLTRDWLPDAIYLSERGKDDVVRADLYEEVMHAILEADLCIFECSITGMSIGHQISFALSKRKNTLVILKAKNKIAKDLFIAGSKSPYLLLKNYRTTKELELTIKNFITKSSTRKKIRFNLVLEPHENDYIRWASFKYKTDKTSILRSALDQKIEADQDYIKYKKKEV